MKKLLLNATVLLAAPAFAADTTFAYLPEEVIRAFADGTNPLADGKTKGFIGTDWVTYTQKVEEGKTFNVLTYTGQTAPDKDGNQSLLYVAWASWEADTGRPASALTIEAETSLVSAEVLEAQPGVVVDGKIVASFALSALPWVLNGANICVDYEAFDVTVPADRHVEKGGDSTAWSCSPLAGFTTVWTEPKEEMWGGTNAVLGFFSEEFAIWANYAQNDDGSKALISGLNFELQYENPTDTPELDGLNACVGAGEAAYYMESGAETQNPGAKPATAWVRGDLKWTMFHGATSPWGGNEKFVRSLGKDFWNFDSAGNFIAGRVDGGGSLVEAGTDYVLPFKDECKPDAEFVR